MTEERDEFRADAAKRLRELRLSLGYKTATSFARAIGYPPSKYSRYEREGFINGGPLIMLVSAIENKLGHGRLSIDWIFDTGAKRKWRRAPAKLVVRTEGNVVHANFAR